ncbi:hypothetical protein ACFQ34_32845 [Pseudonocardia benzenivorans]|uniref:Uncharacterized protein n=1 Tax=Pseudonocardia benzenivorans TaxID=228005 RepID=A0ABW3VS63_9PSEU
MAAPKMKERTIAFFEVVELKAGEHRRIEPMKWVDFLASLSARDLARRTVETDATYVGNTITYEEEDHLLLHRAKDVGEWLSVLNWGTGEWRELEMKAAEGYLESSVVCFLPYGNLVAIMRGSTSAPSHKSLETWLRGLKPFGERLLVVRPLLSMSEIERLQTAEGASRVEIRIGRSKAGALAMKTGRLATFLHRAGEAYGDIDVTMIISIPRGNTRHEDRQELLADLQDLADVMPDAAEKARATLVFAEDSGAEHRQLTEFVEHHITAKRRVRAVTDDGEAIRISSAVSVILDAAAEHEDELRLAANVTNT